MEGWVMKNCLTSMVKRRKFYSTLVQNRIQQIVKTRLVLHSGMCHANLIAPDKINATAAINMPRSDAYVKPAVGPMTEDAPRLDINSYVQNEKKIDATKKADTDMKKEKLFDKEGIKSSLLEMHTMEEKMIDEQNATIEAKNIKYDEDGDKWNGKEIKTLVKNIKILEEIKQRENELLIQKNLISKQQDELAIGKDNKDLYLGP